MRRPRHPALPSLTVSRAAAMVAAAAAAAVCSAGPAAAQGGPGTLDLSFHGTGWTRVDPDGGSAYVNAMLMQPDGRIVFAGTAAGETSSMKVWRVHPDGALDTSFNGTGIVTLTEGGNGLALTLRGDGRILAGSVRSVDSTAHMLVASFLPDGRPDPSFGPGSQGWAPFAALGAADEIVVQPDGKILACSHDFGDVIRMSAGGGRDPGWGSGFSGQITVPGSTGCFGLTVQSDGKILLCSWDSSERYSLMRFHPDGTLDTDFGSGGAVRFQDALPSLPFLRPVRTIVSEDGKILVAGYWSRPPGDPAGGIFVVARFLPGGSLDPAFGDPATPGVGRISFSGMRVRASSVAVQDDGSFLFTGDGWDHSPGIDIVLARFSADGRADAEFGTGGSTVQDMDHTFDSSEGSVLIPGGKVLVGGTLYPMGETGRILLARFNTGRTSDMFPTGTGSSLSVDFGTLTVQTRIILITLKNVAPHTLTNISATLTGASHPGEYQVTLPAAASLAPGAELTVPLSLTLTPSSTPGPRTATLTFTADNLVFGPLTLSLTGAKATPLQVWRYTWFASTDNSGAAADLNDFDGDGMPNFMEYATLSHPHQWSASPLRAAADAPGHFTYTRPAGAAAEFLYEPEAAASLSGPWSGGGLTSEILTDNGAVQTVQVKTADVAAPRMFLRLRVTKR